MKCRGATVLGNLMCILFIEIKHYCYFLIMHTDLLFKYLYILKF